MLSTKFAKSISFMIYAASRESDGSTFLKFMRSYLHPHHFPNFENVNKRIEAAADFSTGSMDDDEFLQVILDNNRRENG